MSHHQACSSLRGRRNRHSGCLGITLEVPGSSRMVGAEKRTLDSPNLPIENVVLRAIRERRSIYRYLPEPVPDEKVQAILEAGRWAPSWTNTQPWEFIVVNDVTTKGEICDIAKSTLTGHRGIEGASLIVVICVNPEIDPYHFVEDGAVATQNMALAAHSLGLASYWIGIYDSQNIQGSVEDRIRKTLNLPRKHRVIAILPIGAPEYKIDRERKMLREITHYDQYGNTRL